MSRQTEKTRAALIRQASDSLALVAVVDRVQPPRGWYCSASYGELCYRRGRCEVILRRGIPGGRWRVVRFARYDDMPPLGEALAVRLGEEATRLNERDAKLARLEESHED
jgi:hypothetical protein